MRTSHTVLALLGVIGLGQMTTQANDMFLAELESDFDLDDEMTFLSGSDKDEATVTKELMAQMTKIIEDQGKMTRRFTKESIDAQKKKAPEFHDDETRKLANSFGIEILKLQHQIMDLGASSHGVVADIQGVERLIPMLSKSTGDKLAKVQSLIFKRLQRIFENGHEATSKMQKNPHFQKMTNFGKNIKPAKENLEQDISDETAKYEANKKHMADLQKKVVSLAHAKLHLDKPSNAKVKKYCDGHHSPSQCTHAMSDYAKAEKHAMDSYMNAQHKKVSSMNHSTSQYNMIHSQQENVVKNIKVFKSDLAKFPSLNSLADDFAQIVVPLNQYMTVSKEIVNDMNHFLHHGKPSDVIDVSNEDYQVIQKYGEETASLSDEEFNSAIKKSLSLAKIQNGCAQAEVDNMVKKLSHQSPSKIPAICGHTKF